MAGLSHACGSSGGVRACPIANRPAVLLHGYSASAESLGAWRELLISRGWDATEIHLGDYVSLSNEISIKDIAEGFDRALREEAGLDADQEFDAIVHSTGGLVIREWLATYASRRTRLKHLVGLAPAMFGSPLAHKGRSWLGAVFKGSKDLGPDFLEAGTQVLLGLEMGSSYSWGLAHRDLVGAEATFGRTADTPWPFIFIGTEGYGGLRGLVTNPEGSDGTVRWAAASLNTRKLVVDLRDSPGVEAPDRVTVPPPPNTDPPLVLVPECNHGTIVSKPPAVLAEMVFAALDVEDFEGYGRWSEQYAGGDSQRLVEPRVHEWQQFVVHAVDERGDPVPDYYVDVGTREEDGTFRLLDHFAVDVHAFTADPSYRCFHVDLTELDVGSRPPLALRLIAESGSDLVAYYGAGTETFTAGEPGKWDAEIDLTPWLADEGVEFFYPFTTTLVEIVLNREPTPPSGVSSLLRFV